MKKSTLVFFIITLGTSFQLNGAPKKKHRTENQVKTQLQKLQQDLQAVTNNITTLHTELERLSDSLSLPTAPAPTSTPQPDVTIVSESENDDKNTPTESINLSQQDTAGNTSLHRAINDWPASDPLTILKKILEPNQTIPIIKNKLDQTPLIMAQHKLLFISDKLYSTLMDKAYNLYEKIIEKIFEAYDAQALGFYTLNVGVKEITLYDRTRDQSLDNAGNSILHRAMGTLHENLISKILALVKQQGKIAQAQYLHSRTLFNARNFAENKPTQSPLMIGICALNDSDPNSFVRKQQADIDYILEDEGVPKEKKERHDKKQKKLKNNRKEIEVLLVQISNVNQKTALIIAQEKLLKKLSSEERALYEKAIEQIVENYDLTDFGMYPGHYFTDPEHHNDIDTQNNTLLHRAILTGHTKLIEQIFNKLEDLDDAQKYLETKNKAGKTAYEIADTMFKLIENNDWIGLQNFIEQMINPPDDSPPIAPAYAYVNHIKTNHAEYLAQQKHIQEKMQRKQAEIAAYLHEMHEKKKIAKEIANVSNGNVRYTNKELQKISQQTLQSKLNYEKEQARQRIIQEEELDRQEHQQAAAIKEQRRKEEASRPAYQPAYSYR